MSVMPDVVQLSHESRSDSQDPELDHIDGKLHVSHPEIFFDYVMQSQGLVESFLGLFLISPSYNVAEKQGVLGLLNRLLIEPISFEHLLESSRLLRQSNDDNLVTKRVIVLIDQSIRAAYSRNPKPLNLLKSVWESLRSEHLYSRGDERMASEDDVSEDESDDDMLRIAIAASLVDTTRVPALMGRTLEHPPLIMRTATSIMSQILSEGAEEPPVERTPESFAR